MDNCERVNAKIMRRHYSTFVFVFFVLLLDAQAQRGRAQTAERDEEQVERLPSRPLVPLPENFPPEDKPQSGDFIPNTDRWTIKPPEYEVDVPGHLWDPYNQNILKGDRPIIGNDIFLNLTAATDTLSEYRRVPTPQLFGNPNQFFFTNYFLLSGD